jgi:hypothetical protein
VYLYKEKWTVEDQKQMVYAQEEFKFFSSPILQESHEDEYPRQNR